MALIKCSECGKEVSSNASACPNCGNPIGSKKIKVHFERKRNMLSAVAVTGTVMVDGIIVGSAGNETSFDVMLSIGNHNITIETKTTGVLASGRSESTNLNIPENATSVSVMLKPKNDATSFIMGGMKIVVDDTQRYVDKQCKDAFKGGAVDPRGSKRCCARPRKTVQGGATTTASSTNYAAW